MKVISDEGWLAGASWNSNTRPPLTDLGRQLRQVYGDVASEAVPEALAAIVRQLDCGAIRETAVCDRVRSWQPLIRSER